MNNNSTINYYNNNAESYYDQTISIDFEDLYARFLMDQHAGEERIRTFHGRINNRSHKGEKE
jgi:hypothetical protein